MIAEMTDDVKDPVELTWEDARRNFVRAKVCRVLDDSFPPGLRLAIQLDVCGRTVVMPARVLRALELLLRARERP